MSESKTEIKLPILSYHNFPYFLQEFLLSLKLAGHGMYFTPADLQPLFSHDVPLYEVPMQAHLANLQADEDSATPSVYTRVNNHHKICALLSSAVPLDMRHNISDAKQTFTLLH